jgi:hypothetical protein
MLSIGTAGASAAGMAGDVPASGAGWIVLDKIIPLMMEAQERLASEQCATLLDGRYMRLSPVPSPGQSALKALDVVDASMTATLQALGHATFAEARSQHFGKLNLSRCEYGTRKGRNYRGKEALAEPSAFIHACISAASAGVPIEKRAMICNAGLWPAVTYRRAKLA